MIDYTHKPVLLEEAISGLNIKEDGIYVDCTLGGGGHSSEILKKIKKGKLFGFDQDDYAIDKAKTRLSKISDNFEIIRSNFVNIKEELKRRDIKKVNGVLYDLGVSSFQFDITERGFSYSKDSKLDMRMDTNQYLSAYDIVNFYDYDELKRIFYTYGEERFAPSIAKRIIKEREKKPIDTTFELVEIIKRGIPAYVKRKSSHPAKKVFQALRIAVNDELNVFEISLRKAIKMLAPKGRIAVISFHSLEDRICKKVFKEFVTVDIPKGIPVMEKDIHIEYRIITRKPIVASKKELENNNRAHSAKLRILEKI